MYKKQLTLQKILCFAALGAAAVVFVYALGLMTDLYDSLYYTMMDPTNPQDTWVQGSWLYYDMQPFNRQLLEYAIGLVLLACLLFITGNHKRRRYYAGNVISTCLFCLGGTALSLWTHVQLEAFKALYLKINFEELAFFADLMDTPYIESTFWFDLHYGVFALVIAVCAGLIISLVWKFSLMRAEKRLVEEGRRAQA